MTARTYKPTEAELEILQILWEKGPSSVHEVNEKLQKIKSVGYTTTLKLMQIMVDKGLALRDTSMRKHIYRAAVKKSDTQKQLLNRMVDLAFGGSAVSMALQVLGDTQASTEEIEKLKDLITKLENKD